MQKKPKTTNSRADPGAQIAGGLQDTRLYQKWPFWRRWEARPSELSLISCQCHGNTDHRASIQYLCLHHGPCHRSSFAFSSVFYSLTVAVKALLLSVPKTMLLSNTLLICLIFWVLQVNWELSPAGRNPSAIRMKLLILSCWIILNSFAANTTCAMRVQLLGLTKQPSVLLL